MLLTPARVTNLSKAGGRGLFGTAALRHCGTPTRG